MPLKRVHLFSDLFLYKFIYYFWLCWVFLLCVLSLVAASKGYCLDVAHGRLVAVASLVLEQRFKDS